MRIIFLALLVATASFCKKPSEQAPSQQSASLGAASNPQPPLTAEAPNMAELIEKSAYYKLQMRVQSKSGPEYLDELIERANTPDSREITLDRIKESPDFYYGHPWWFSGKLIHVRQSDKSGRHSIAIDGTNNIRMEVSCNFTIDFVKFEEVDVIGYITDESKDGNFHSMLAHSILKKGTIKARLRQLERLKKIADESE